MSPRTDTPSLRPFYFNILFWEKRYVTLVYLDLSEPVHDFPKMRKMSVEGYPGYVG